MAITGAPEVFYHCGVIAMAFYETGNFIIESRESGRLKAERPSIGAPGSEHRVRQFFCRGKADRQVKRGGHDLQVPSPRDWVRQAGETKSHPTGIGRTDIRTMPLCGKRPPPVTG